MNRVFGMEEQWKQWAPIEGLAQAYYLDAVLGTVDGFTICLSPMDATAQKVQVVFDDFVDAYRKADRNCRSVLIDMLHEQYGSDFYRNWAFFKVEHSSYIQWLSERSQGVSDYCKFVHFAFIAEDAVLDVVTNYEPTIVLIDPYRA
jgi:hypothetical protein